MTQTQKEQNKNFILNNPDKFIIDGKGNFVNLEKDYKDEDYTVYPNNVKDYKEVKEKVSQVIVKDKSKWKLITNKEIIEDIMEEILLEKEDWEIVLCDFKGNENCPEATYEFYKHRLTGKKLDAYFSKMFNFEQNYILMGELGWRKDMHENYEKWGIYRTQRWWKKRKQIKAEENASTLPTNNYKQPENPQSEEEKLRAEENRKYEEARKKAETENKSSPKNNPENKRTNNPSDNNQKKDNLSPDKQTNTLSNSLPSSTDIQNQYNSDKDKSKINNNPNLTDSKEKQKAEELLKVIIKAELLAKKEQFDQEILTKLLAEKGQNSSIYQLLNKEKRIDKIINQLEEVKKSQKQNSDKPIENKNKQNKKFPTRIIVGGIIFLFVVVIVIIWPKKGKKPKKQKKKKIRL